MELKNKDKMDSCSPGLAFPSLFGDKVEMQLNRTPNSKRRAPWLPLRLCRAGVIERAYAPERSARREREGVDEGGRLERRGVGAGGVEGWQMPEGFIRLEGGREQFLWKSIRLKHKHRCASNPGLAPHSLSYGISPRCFLVFAPPTRL